MRIHWASTGEDGGVRIGDRIDYRILGGRAAARWLVEPDLESVFAHRQWRAAALLTTPAT
jgi:hypothetical protein